MTTEKLKNISYTPEQIARLIYEQLADKLPHQAKHDEYRDDLPWFLCQAGEIVAKYGDVPLFNEENEP